MNRTPILTTVLAVLVIAVACSDAPRSVPVAKSPPGASKGMSGDLPPNHPPIGDEEPEPQLDLDATAQFSGKVNLTGELAQKRAGSVFVSVRPIGGRTPFLSYKVDLADPKLTAPVLVEGADGGRELHFMLNGTTSMMAGGVPKDVPLELQVMFDPDGFVDTKDGVIEAVVPTKSGDANLVLTLNADR